MKPRLIILLVLIVVAPLAVVGWLGVRLASRDQRVVEHSFRELILGQLRNVDQELNAALELHRQAVLAEMTPLSAEAPRLRELSRQSPFVLQYYVQDVAGSFVFPPVRTPEQLTERERKSLLRTRQVWDNGALQNLGRPADTTSSKLSFSEPEPDDGWYAWYWGNGMQLMLWIRDGDLLHVAELNRARLISDLIGALPETDDLAPQLSTGRIRLLDAGGRALYEWGAYAAEENDSPVASLALEPPLSAWSLEYHAPSGTFGSAAAGGVLFNVVLVVGITLMAIVVVGMTVYVYREHTRELREASKRVSFVNQVSHELKTPLTNIRMYAELLDQDLPDSDDRSRRNVGVIVEESRRLSRLIANVLTFGRNQRGALTLHRQSGVIDDVLRSVLNHFAPALAARHIDVQFEPGADREVMFDQDALEQIIGNLLGNVEKYAWEGRKLEVVSRCQGETVEILVTDNGPGIPQHARERVFEPFFRLGDSPTEGVAGTGIGLSIARDLARLHGGDLELMTRDVGTQFRLRIVCPGSDGE